MWNSAKDPQEEKYQQKIEAILEEKHKAILERSHLLINIIFVLLGAYALILAAIFFPSISNNSNSTTLNSINQIPPWATNIILGLSLASILIAFAYIWNSLFICDNSFKNKFYQNADNISVHLKDGKKLMDRNNLLFEITEILLKNNDNSVAFILLSLLFFIAFITSIKNTLPSFIGFALLLIVSVVFLRYFDNKRKSRKK
jgi:hypothetical protein